MKTQIKLALLVMSIVFTLVQPISAYAGPSNGGGGDPDAVEFLLVGKSLNQWISKSNFGLSIEDKKSINHIVEQLSDGMNNQDVTPIKFVNRELQDKSGAFKVALFSNNPFSILVDRSAWKKSNEESKLIVVLLETLGLANIKDRYNLAGKVKESIGAISSIQNDIILQEFLIGSWLLDSGVCLSGAPVHTGSDNNNMENYELKRVFNPDLTFKYELIFKNILLASGKGIYSVKDANLIATTVESCRYDSNAEQPCETALNGKDSTLMTIQNNQIWFLSNQGRLGGSCPPNDIFVMKFKRR